ncbi:MAG: ABC transporter substrate-binding protein [Candidatus Binatia bacterium]
MRRRQFIAFLSGAAAWPLAARAQQPAMPVIGYMDVGVLEGRRAYAAALSRGLAELGFVEGRNVTIDYRSAEQQPDRLTAIAADFVSKRVSVIVATGGTASGKAAKAATATIPIVFQTGSDPVAVGLVASLNRPGGNVTGTTILTAELAGKRFDLMQELVPGAAAIGYLEGPGGPGPPGSMVAAARTLGRQVVVLRVAGEADLSQGFAMAVERNVQALILAPRPLFVSNHKKIAALAAEHRIPVMSYERTFPEQGGLISYGANIPDAYRIVGTYVGRILKGESPAVLPVQESTRTELVINLKTAKALGLAVPPGLLVFADEVIE